MATFSSSVHPGQSGKKTYTFPFIVITILFFMWGFMTVLNDILIPYFKRLFDLNYVEATLVQFAFFGAYFIGALIYLIASLTIGDLIGKIGYKNGLILGLIVSGLGCALFYPAADLRAYGLFLGALFCLGLGFTLLQIAANPYVAILGSSDTASSRLNLAQGFNSLGTTIGPAIGAYLIFGTSHSVELGAETLQKMYLTFACIFILMALVIKLVDLPSFKGESTLVKEAGALKYSHLVFGIFAIFFYVGGEVSVGSLLLNYLKLPEIAGLSEQAGSKYLSFYWGGLMIGRFLGAVSLNTSIKDKKRYLIMAALGVFAVVVIGMLTDWKTAFIYAIIVVLNLLAFLIGKGLASRTLGVFSIIVVLMLLIGIFAKGQFAMWAVIGIGLFNSVMWSNIFTLAIHGLGRYTSQGSSLLIMAILGAALIPVLQGAVADSFELQVSFIVPVFCYLYLIFYGFFGSVPSIPSKPYILDQIV
jgi:MFS transporter, FHS family, L-fucose permease